MKRPGIHGAGAVALLALAAVTVQAGPHREAAHENAASPTVTVQHWAGGTYTPGVRAAHDISVHVTAVERSLRRNHDVRSVSAPAGSDIPGIEHDARTSTLSPAPASTPAPRRGA